MKKASIIFLSALFPIAMIAQDMSSFQKKEFTRDGNTLLYRVLYPKNYNKSKTYPVLTFLHGSGERGNDNEAQLKHGGRLFDSLQQTFKAIVIFPQLPSDSTWNYISSRNDRGSTTGRAINLTFNPKPTTPARLVKLLLDSLLSARIADPRKMYIGGLSLGGFGTFDMIQRYPNFFAAAIPICGGGDLEAANRYAKTVSLWIFHGSDDNAVDVKNSREAYAALKKLGADVQYTEYPGVGHNSWDNVFAEKNLLPWLLSKSKTKAKSSSKAAAANINNKKVIQG
ncbi:MAG TPA: dienelactone hydrolase family protein [Chitinophagaceae bacterium]|jgi:predicted peptidase|nr:dienelactone hydrolase family protein [Chitinophagaceae bacterium]